MSDYDEGGRLEIGEVLKRARTRQGLDVRTVEERTKIRIKYLRALEAGDWEALPSPAYAKGFLRTYAKLLGLDADALVDEFRRQVEAGRSHVHPVGGDRVLGGRRGDAEARGPSLGAVAGIGVAVALVFLLLLGLTGGSGDDADRDRAERREARQDRRARERRRDARERAPRDSGARRGPIRLRLAVAADVRVCLVGDGDQPLVDGQVLAAGSEETFEAERFVLGFPSGYDPDRIRLSVGGQPARLPEDAGPVAYRITARDRIRPAPDPGPGCP